LVFDSINEAGASRSSPALACTVAHSVDRLIRSYHECATLAVGFLRVAVGRMIGIALEAFIVRIRLPIVNACIVDEATCDHWMDALARSVADVVSAGEFVVGAS